MHGDSSHAGYVYNYDGSLHEVYNAKSTPDQIADYTYTDAGLLDTATYGNSRTLANTWDADGNRVEADMNGTTWDYIYDPTAGIPAVIEEKTGSTPNYYIREPGGSLLARQRETAVCYYHFDQLGSTRMLTDGSGTVTDKYAYDAYGALISHIRSSGSVDQPYQYVGELGYYTHYQEPDFKLLSLGVRFYDAGIGRFTQRDPVKDGLNLYLYVHGCPTRIADPWGLYGVGGNNGNWCENINSFIGIGCNKGVADCLEEAGHQAMDEVIKKYGTMVDATESNAVLHCTMTCKMANHCGRKAAVCVSNNHEKYN